MPLPPTISRRQLALAGGSAAMLNLGRHASLAAATTNPPVAEGSVRLSRYDGNFKDKSRAFHDAFEDMRARGIGTLIVPRTTNGGADRWICQNPIWDRQHELPEGATLAGETAVNGFAQVIGPQVVYEGDRAIVAMDYTKNTGFGYALPRNIRDIAFMWTELGALGFIYGNDPRHYAASDTDSASYIMHLRLTGTGSFGYIGSAKGPLNGDGVALAKAMGFYCGSGWFPGGPCRRTFWFRGCDDATVRMQRGGGGRYVMQEAANTFGSNLVVETNWIAAGNPGLQSEEEYALWDSGNGSRFQFGHIELTAVGSAQKALMYVNGSHSRYTGGVLNGLQGGKGVALFHVGPNARDVIMDGAICLNDAMSQIPSYSPPANGYAFGDPGRNGRVLVRGGNTILRQLVASNPRILCAADWPDSAEAVRTPIRRWDAPSTVTSHGLFPQGAVYSPRGIVPPQNGYATIFPEVVPDANVADGFVWRLIAGKSGMVFSLAAGSSFGIGDRIRMFYRARSQSAGEWNMIARLNDQPYATIGHANTAGQWQIEEKVIETAAMKRGDILSFLAEGQAGHDAFIEYLGWENLGSSGLQTP